MSVHEIAKLAKQSAFLFRAKKESDRNKALHSIASVIRANKDVIISENAKDISGNAKDTVDSLKPIMLIGIAIIAFKTISEFDSKEMGSNLTRAAMFA